MPHFVIEQAAIDHLSAHDKRLAAAIAEIGPIERAITPDPFIALIKSIISQQISTKAAASVFARLADGLGELTPERIASLGATELCAFGMSGRKASYIGAIARAAVDRTIDFGALPGLTDSEVMERLLPLPGIGVWTVEMLLIFSLQRPDVLSEGDLAIKRGMMRLYSHKELPKARFERYRKRYSPFGSVASLYLWAIAGGQM